MTPRITVVGSANVGVAELRRIPGGKGANQAVAAARLGAQPSLPTARELEKPAASGS